MMPRPGTQACVVSRADKIVISALFASSHVRSNIYYQLLFGKWARAPPHEGTPFFSEIELALVSESPKRKRARLWCFGISIIAMYFLPSTIQFFFQNSVITETRDYSEFIRIWTRDLQIFSLTLSQLSYLGTWKFILNSLKPTMSQ